MKTKQIKNFKMNDVTYKMRRSVIEILYTAKSKGIILPRINVRIGESTHNYPNVLGVGGNLNIWITKTAIDRSSDYLLHVVLHELCHAIFNLPHNESCPLMASVLDKPCTNAQAWKIFEGYYYEDVRTVRQIHYHASKCAMAS
tara:strand:- start:354 stop:782 length:429 start_codon:yes stop_codon:yes gene_type:complete